MGETNLHLRSVTFCIRDWTIDKFISFCQEVCYKFQSIDWILQKSLKIGITCFSEFLLLPHNALYTLLR